jgi:hypothetical protein
MSLGVPYVSDEDGNLCVPSCIKMVLDYVRNAVQGEVSLPSFELEEIMEIVETQATGTDFMNVRKMNVKLEKTVPSVEFDVNPASRQFRDIEEELAERRPVIAWLYVTIDEDGCYHAVVITGYDRTRQIIMLNDPMRGKIEQQVGQFMAEWQKTGQMLIKLKVGKKVQRKLTEYLEEKAERRMEVVQPGIAG